MDEHFAELETANEKRQRELLGEIIELQTFSQREFSRIYRRQQSIIDEHCPNTFTLIPLEGRRWTRPFQQKIELQLFCQAPGCWHPTEQGGLYSISQPAEWLRAMTPYLQVLVKYLKFVTPLAGPWLSVIVPDYAELVNDKIKLTEALVKKLPDLKTSPDVELPDKIGERKYMERVEGAPLRALRTLLDEVDPPQHWGGLRKILTPEGHYLWLCDYHAQEYR